MEIYFTIVTSIGTLLYIIAMIFAESNLDRKEIFPFFIVIPFSFLLVPLIGVGILGLGITYFISETLPNFLFKNK